jgi:1-acyl-sn-glycerol-3-phosphate acyltransferase
MRPALLSMLYTRVIGRDRAAWLAAMQRATMTGSEHIRLSGGVLIVGNHALLGADSAPLISLVMHHTGRVPRMLGERNLWRIPGAKPVLDALGAIPGEPEAAVRLLQAGEMVLVYPGGTNDSFKTRAEAYRLKWGNRTGFARVAMRAKVPIAPVAATGIDEIFHVMARERWIGRRIFGSPHYDLPIPRSLIPRRVKLVYNVLPIVDTSGDPDDAQAVERVRRSTYDAIELVLRGYRESISP